MTTGGGFAVMLRELKFVGFSLHKDHLKSDFFLLLIFCFAICLFDFFFLKEKLQFVQALEPE